MAPRNDRASATRSYASPYKTARWRKKRKAQLSREPFCRLCKQRGETTAATVADHVQRHNGDERRFWSIPLQSLCASCHSGAKAQLEQSGYLRGCGVDGAPLDSDHWWNT